MEFFIVERFAPKRRVVTRSILPVLTRSTIFGRPSFTFEDGFGLDARSKESGSRTARGNKFKAERFEFLANRNEMALIAVVHAEEDGGLSSADAGRGELCFGKCLAVRSRDTMTSPVERISGPRIVSTPRNLLNGKTGDFDGVKIVHGRLPRRHCDERAATSCPSVSSRPMRRAANFGEWNTVALLNVRHSARGARVHFENVNCVPLNGVLHVHEPDDLKRDWRGASCNRESWSSTVGVRLTGGRTQLESPEWTPASSMCSMMPPNDDIAAVGERVYVDFRGFFQELVYEHRFRGAMSAACATYS